MKYKFKQYLALCLSVLTLATLIPITSYAANDSMEGNGGGTGNGGDWTGSSSY